MPHIDLDERRRLLEPTTITANGRTYTLPVYMPAMVMQAMFAMANAAQDAEAAARAQRLAYVAVFGEELADQALLDFSDEDFQDLSAEIYRVSSGESSASGVSSPSTGTKPRRTSRGSTK